jgi:MtN3 and saliva related transmembrane protein
MDIKPIVGIAAGILTAASTLPQIIKIIRNKEAEAVSPVMFFILLAGNSLWCFYGVLLADFPIICTNAFSVILNIVMIYLNYKYSKKSR